MGQEEHGGLVIESLTQGGGVAGYSLIGVTALCPWTRHFIFCLELVQPRKTHPNIPEKLLTGT